jgi:hypothetical protein
MCPHPHKMYCFTMIINMGETMKTVSGSRWGCLYPLYICWDTMIGATNTCVILNNEMSCPQLSLYDVSESTQNVLFHDEHQYGGNDENRLRTSVGVFISFVYMLRCYNWGHKHLSDPGWRHVMSQSVPIWCVHIHTKCVVSRWTSIWGKRWKPSPDLGGGVYILCIYVGML